MYVCKYLCYVCLSVCMSVCLSVCMYVCMYLCILSQTAASSSCTIPRSLLSYLFLVSESSKRNALHVLQVHTLSGGEHYLGRGGAPTTGGAADGT